MRAKSIFFHVLMITVIAGCAALGVWQVQRREWKHQLIKDISARQTMAPVGLYGPLSDQFIWRRVRIDGVIDYSHALKIPRYAQDMPCAKDGAHGVIILAPVRLADGSHVLFRAGWFPGDDFKAPRQQTIHAIGVIHPFDQSWMSAHDTHSDEWLRPAPRMYDALKLPRLNYYVDNAAADENCDFPVPMWHAPELPDNHLQYAITWFALAAALLALYIYRTWTVRKNHPKNHSKASC